VGRPIGKKLPIDEARVRDLNAKGWSLRKIAREVGVTLRTIQRRFPDLMRKRRGPPSANIDFQKVEALAAIGCSQEEIAAELGIGETTLKRHCSVILKNGTKKCHVRIRSAMFRHAVKGDPRLLVFLGKVYLGLKEDPQTVVNVSQTAVSITDQTKARLAELHALIRRETAIGDHNGDRN
jgi:predicted transcriptional regulator